MFNRSMKTLWKAALVLVSMVILNPIAAAASAPENFQVVDGVAIYVGVMPAQIVRGRLQGLPEAKMHGGVPAGHYEYHVVVALFDNATGRRIENAQVTAAVMELGLGSEWKTLGPMRIADSVTYGNYFDMPDNAIYHIQVRIRFPGHAQLIEATFTHRHFK
jgi:hypothetical protein